MASRSTTNSRAQFTVTRPRGAIAGTRMFFDKSSPTSASHPTRMIYVGDTLMKDVLMAQQAGVRDVWAKYGEAQASEEYDGLCESPLAADSLSRRRAPES